MVYTKMFFIEITTLEQISNDRVFLSIKRNIPDSFVKLFSAENILIKDVKK